MKTNTILLLFTTFFLFSACEKEEPITLNDSLIGTWRWTKTINGFNVEETPGSSGKRLYIKFDGSGEYTEIENGEITKTSSYSIEIFPDETEYVTIDSSIQYNINYTEDGFELRRYTYSPSGGVSSFYEAP